MYKNFSTFQWLTIALAITCLVGYLDWITGYELSFFVFYFVPISITAWFISMQAAVTIAFLSMLVWLVVDSVLGHEYSSHLIIVWNTLIRLISFLAIGIAITRIRWLLTREQVLSRTLRAKLDEIRLLESFLPICCECKKIRGDDGDWHSLENYIGERTGTKFSHGYCPECAVEAKRKAGLS